MSGSQSAAGHTSPLRRNGTPSRLLLSLNESCDAACESEQVHIQLGGPGEMVVVYTSQDESVDSSVAYWEADEPGLVLVANGSSSAYSQLMWLEARALTDPPLGAAGAQPSELMALQDTTSWASHLPVAPFGRSQSYHAAAARPTSGLGEYNNPAMYYN